MRYFYTVIATVVTIALLNIFVHCDPDGPIDVGVTSAPCPEAAAPAPTPPSQAYVPTKAEEEMVKMIDRGELGTGEERERWWKRYAELSDASRLEREARDK